MKILAIETSCDDTCAAVLENDRVLSNVVSSQTDLHKDWGGVVPDIAKRAHQERIEPVVKTGLKRARVGMEEIDVIAVTVGPGLAPALGVGVNFARELAGEYKKRLVAVNHIEGHILSNWIKNKNSKPERRIELPALVITVSGGHSKVIVMRDFGRYEVVGETLDDAAGEALDKAAKLLGLGYPGGPVVETVANNGQTDWLKLPKPLPNKNVLDFSFSGLKTSFYYQIKDWPQEKTNKHLTDLAASFQEAVFEHLVRKYKLAIERYQPKTLLASGGVMANQVLRKKLRKVAREAGLPIYLPYKKVYNTDNAAMIGVAGYYKALREEWSDPKTLDREPRAKLN